MVIAALTSTGMAETMLVEGATGQHVVEAHAEQVLGPTLRPGQLWFLPPSSPDLSPIELAFAKIKQAVRQAATRTHEALAAAIAPALLLMTASAAEGFFARCGFLTDPPIVRYRG